jgi:ABC-type branched-subunit amino acid transport system substrate-binding protein
MAGSAAPAGAAPKGKTIKVMVIYEKSTGLAASPDLPQGTLAAAKALNKGNGVGGDKVKVLLCDTNDDPNTAAECGRQAVSDGVVALVNVFSLHGDAFLPLMLDSKIPAIGITAASAADFTSGAAFPLEGGAVASFGGLPVYLANSGAKNIALARPDIAAGTVTRVFGNAALAKSGMQYTNDVPVPNDAPDMSSYVQAALAGGTDGIVVGLSGQQATNFVQAAKQADPNVKIALVSTEPAKTRAALGSEATGIIQESPFLGPSIEKTKEGARYRAEMKAAGYPTDDNGINGWLSMQVLASVAQGLPDVTAPALFDKLSTTTGLNTGLTPPLQFTTPANIGIALPRIFNVCTIGIQLTRGNKVKALTGKFYDPYSGQDCPTP